MTFDIAMRKINTGQKTLFVLGPKTWSKTKPSIKNVKTSSFLLDLKKHISLYLHT